MARFKDREEAIKLRKQEMSYGQIKKILGVSKGTLSVWLKNYPLSKERIRELRDCNEQRIEKYKETMRKKRQQRLDDIYKIQKEKILPLNDKELFVAGLMLYWGEGSKNTAAALILSNSDPSVLKFFIYWINKALSIPKKRLKVQVQLYNDMDIEKELNYWSKILKISLEQFNHPYIKKTSSQRINHKGSFGHGTCQITIGGVENLNKVLMGIKAISDSYNKRP